MAASDWVTPTPSLVPGTTARSEEVNAKFAALEAAFEKMPVPRNDGKAGFGEAISTPSGVLDDQHATRAYVQEIFSQLQESIAEDTAEELAKTPEILAGATEARVKVISDATYTVVAEDNNYILWFTSDEPVTLTFPSNETLPFDKKLQGVIIQAGDGQVTVAEGSGVTVGASGGLLSTAGNYSPMSYFRFNADFWWLGGERA
tara:strand:- start:2544 stop:3152 length:609 start_codon:yes stop_codon:yes gene_type:complete